MVLEVKKPGGKALVAILYLPQINSQIKDLEDERIGMEILANDQLLGTATRTKYRWLIQMSSGEEKVL